MCAAYSRLNSAKCQPGDWGLPAVRLQMRCNSYYNVSTMDLMTTQWLDTQKQYCPEYDGREIETCDWLQRVSPHLFAEDRSPIDISDEMARAYCLGSREDYRKSHGQYFTPPVIARFMAGWSNPLEPGSCIIDPGAGTGVLVSALAEHSLRRPSMANQISTRCLWPPPLFYSNPAVS